MAEKQGHIYNQSYQGENLNRVAFPIGGIGAGMFAIEGTGAISHLSVRHQMDVFNEPNCFAAIAFNDHPEWARVLEGPVPEWKAFGAPGTGTGMGGKSWGLPRYDKCEFIARFPFAEVKLRDQDLPFNVEIKAWNPFIPGDADNSSLPVGGIEYTFSNLSEQTLEAVFSFNSTNFLQVGSGGDCIKSIPQGFVLSQDDSAGSSQQTDFAFFTDQSNTVVNHCWLGGGWWIPLTMVWHMIETAQTLSNPPVAGPVPGASLYVPFSLQPGQAKTIRLMQSWFSPNTCLRQGKEKNEGAFSYGPTQGTEANQGPVSGFLGKSLLNTFDLFGDGGSATLTSPVLTISDDYLHFLIAGGRHPGKNCFQLLLDGEVVRSATGDNTNHLKWSSWDVSDLKGESVVLQVADCKEGSWAYILLDHVISSNQPIKALVSGPGNELNPAGDYRVIADFEAPDWGDWVADPPVRQQCCNSDGGSCGSKFYQPWYAQRFADVFAVADYWQSHYDALRNCSQIFRDAFYDSTLPEEVIEAVAANLTILKTPTILRQTDGRLWGWEGCHDNCGCCYGSCTHVWNYAQALPHLFPELERGFRRTEFGESMDSESGRQIFRSALPIRPNCTGAVAMDGQLGGILKMYREWRISGDLQWLQEYWPRILASMNFMIESTDPQHGGLPVETQHNTYDINYFGPNCHIAGFYLAALQAVVEMGNFLIQDTVFYQRLLEKGRARYQKELFNGDFFIQKVVSEGLRETPLFMNPNDQKTPFNRQLAETINQQGPLFQFGEGCLSDGVLGLWIAAVCGLEKTVVDPDLIKRHLSSVYRYNFKKTLCDHANPQRPTYALGQEGGLLLCSWPHGNKLLLPFVYSDEVWTGIEYQVASHMMMMGMVEEGLEIVRTCRDRYDGRIRNPFNEYECGHWYARAMSSYGLIQGLTGIRYDAVDRILFFSPSIDGDFRTFLSTASGFGVAGIQDGKPFLDVRYGTIEVNQTILNGVAV